jgi:hypothetical protein
MVMVNNESSGPSDSTARHHFARAMESMPTPPTEHSEVQAAIDLLEAWIEVQRVYR